MKIAVRLRGWKPTLGSLIMKTAPRQSSPRLVLASASPRRRELLSGLDVPFAVVVPEVVEAPWPGEAPASCALRLAHEKAQAVMNKQPRDMPVCVIGADTIVVLGREMLGKPASEIDAAETLRALSGRRHVVITGLCVWRRDAMEERILSDAVRTSVTFRHLDAGEISRYVATGEPMDKAGSYAIQGGAAGMVECVEGSYSNVVGLPMEALTAMLGRLGITDQEAIRL